MRRSDNDPDATARRWTENPGQGYEAGYRYPLAGPTNAPIDPAPGYLGDPPPGPLAGTTGHDATASGAMFASGLNILAGVWLIIAPFVLDYRNTGDGFNGYWNDVVIGITIAVLAALKVAAPRTMGGISWVNFVLGGWLIIAPFVLAYNVNADAPAAMWNDIVIGILVVILAARSALGSALMNGRSNH
jgi:hypothetical protein